MKKAIIGALALLVVATVPGVAQTYRGEARTDRQINRIERGVARGALTPRETRRLAEQQRRIQRAKARAARDGYVSPSERRDIERMQNRASRNIARKAHNGRSVY